MIAAQYSRTANGTTDTSFSFFNLATDAMITLCRLLLSSTPTNTKIPWPNRKESRYTQHRTTTPPKNNNTIASPPTLDNRFWLATCLRWMRWLHRVLTLKNIDNTKTVANKMKNLIQVEINSSFKRNIKKHPANAISVDLNASFIPKPQHIGR